MAYCGYADVALALQNMTIAAASTNPTQSEVTGYIALIEAEIDAVLSGAGIVTPVTAAAKTAFLKKVSIDGTAAMVLRSLNMELDLAAQFQAAYEKALAGIRDNPGSIELATPTAGYVTGRTPASDEERHWNREDDNW